MDSNQLRGGPSRLLPTLQRIEQNTRHILTALEHLPVLTAEETACHVVGESYSRWDATANYLPTLSFLFRESTPQGKGIAYPKRAQIKVRIKYQGTELNDDIIQGLRDRCNALDRLSFVHGQVRCNYVSPTRSFKTTVFSEHRDHAVRVLDAVCRVVEQPFDPAFLSVTSQRQRPSPTKRNKPLAGVGLNPANYATPFPLHLFKVILLVNGLKKPILISKF